MQSKKLATGRAASLTLIVDWRRAIRTIGWRGPVRFRRHHCNGGRGTLVGLLYPKRLEYLYITVWR